MADSIISSLKEQGKAVMVMMGVAIIAVLAMIVLAAFRDITHSLPQLGNASIGVNRTITIALDLFIASFGIVGAFASITMLIIVVKVIIGVVRGLKT